jgi:hypothetical protein
MWRSGASSGIAKERKRVFVTIGCDLAFFTRKILLLVALLSRSMHMCTLFRDHMNIDSEYPRKCVINKRSKRANEIIVE